MDKNAVEIINPITIETGLPPRIFITVNAIRLCRPQSSIANASKNPPRKRKITELKYDEAISSPPITPYKGKRIKGNNEVAASGIASVIHQTAIKTATDAV